jgi:cobalamin biosynthesis Mg chelatase CobN
VKYLSLLIVCCAALAFPAGAAAIKCAPPGVSGVSQYFETVPGSSCNHPSSGPGSGSGTGSLPAGTSKQLSKAGAVGNAIKQLVGTSGSNSGSSSSGSGARGSGSSGPNARSGKSSVRGNSGSGVGPAVNGSGRGPLSALLHPILTGSSSGGLGVLLPILLGAALVAVLFGTVVRRRVSSHPPPQA